MAEATNPMNPATNRSQVYIVQTETSSPNQQLGTEEITEQIQQVEYVFPKKTRRKIAAIRMQSKKGLYDNALDFYGLRLVRGDQIDAIEKATKKANKELQEINKSLHANVIFVPIDLNEVQKGEMYGQVLSAIRYKVLSEVITRLEDKVGDLPKGSKEAMLKMLERMRTINVFNDPDIELKISEIKEKIITQDLETIKKELSAELKITQMRTSYLHLG